MLFTNHETRNTDFVAVVFAVGAQGTHNQEPPPGLPPPPPGRCLPARCGAAWGGYGAAWAAAVPRSATRPVGLSPATNHATCFPPALRRLQGEQLQARPTGFSRITAFFRITAFYPPRCPVHYCPPLPVIARHCSAKNIVPASVSTPSAVLERPCGEITPPSGLLGLRRRQNDAMLRKENVLDSANRGTFCLVLTNTRDSLQPDALASGLHFSPCGEAKCVRGPSGRGARRLARAVALRGCTILPDS